MVKTLHIASQYLAAAGISLLEKKSDDSHTNLGWSVNTASIETHSLNNENLKLALNVKEFSLEWKNEHGKILSSLLLENENHKIVVEWIQKSLMEYGVNKPYNYHFHYDTGYAEITDNFRFNRPLENDTNRMIKMLDTAQLAIDNTLNNLGLNSSIRIWPHHFDLGSFVVIHDDLSIGLGLAIPDNMSSEHYYYVSGWNKQGNITTDDLRSLTYGHWKNNSWKGAMLPADGLTVNEVQTFLTESMEAYINLYTSEN